MSWTFEDIIKAPYRTLIRYNRHRTTEVFLIGYPRSGTTWTRFLLGRYIQNLCNTSELKLFATYDVLGRCERACLGPSMNFSHGGLRWFEHSLEDLNYESFIAPYLAKKIVLLTRYPLDVVVSNWAYDHHISERYTKELSEYMREPLLGLARCIHFNNLYVTFRSNSEDFFLSKYENLTADTRESMKALISFLKLPMREEMLSEAVEYASFENMKHIQAEKGNKETSKYKSKFFQVGNPENPEAHHIRKGKVGGYHDYLTKEEVKKYEAIVANEMDPLFGYGKPLK